MPEIHKNQRFSIRRILLIIFLGSTFFALLLGIIVRGKNIALFDPKGLIAQQQYDLMVFTIILLFAIAIPTLFILFFVAWKYRDSNPKAIHTPVASRSKFLVLSLWLVPTAFMLALASVMIPATHDLAPQKSIASDTKPLTIQVVALRWKWLFIYPEQKIATVNFVQIPVDTPVTFELTADETPMSSFWVPNLGGQLYAMTGHVNTLNLMATTTGDYPGSTAEINGRGFAGMKFTARASSIGNFNNWVQEIRQSPAGLDAAAYERLLQPSENNQTAFYSTYENNLYDNVVMKYNEGHAHNE